MRLFLAIQCFWLILFGRPLPAKVLPKQEALPPPAPPPPAPEKKKEKVVDGAAHQRDGALALLGLFQREGRLVDFLREDLTGFDDAQIGAVARDVHRGGKKVIEQVFGFEPVLPGAEDAAVTVPKGFDPAEIRLVGEAKGEPPFKGTLRHHGWRASKIEMPRLAEGVDRSVVAPAEVEV